jgi:hypothetical protein
VEFKKNEFASLRKEERRRLEHTPQNIRRKKVISQVSPEYRNTPQNLYTGPGKRDAVISPFGGEDERRKADPYKTPYRVEEDRESSHTKSSHPITNFYHIQIDQNIQTGLSISKPHNHNQSQTQNNPHQNQSQTSNYHQELSSQYLASSINLYFYSHIP